MIYALVFVSISCSILAIIFKIGNEVEDEIRNDWLYGVDNNYKFNAKKDETKTL